MTPEVQHVFEIIAGVFAYSAAATTTAIAIFYRALFDWKRTPAGRVFSAFTLALSAVFLLSASIRLFGSDYEYRYLLTSLVFGWWAFVSARLIVELFRSWRHGEPRLFDLSPKPRSKKHDGSG